MLENFELARNDPITCCGCSLQVELPGIDALAIAPGRHAKNNRTDDNVEPVFYHAWGEDVYAEFMHIWGWKAVVDATPGPGYCALAAVMADLPYLGICLTDAHRDALTEQIVKMVFAEMQREGSSIYDPRIIEALKGSESQAKGKEKDKKKKKRSGSDESSESEPSPPKKRSKKGSDKKKKKTKKKDNESADDSSSLPEKDPTDSDGE